MLPQQIELAQCLHLSSTFNVGFHMKIPNIAVTEPQTVWLYVRTENEKSIVFQRWDNKSSWWMCLYKQAGSELGICACVCVCVVISLTL